MTGPVPVTLVLDDGRERTVPVRSGETVVEASDRVGVPVPRGCLTGACGTCTGRVVDGDPAGRDDGDGTDRGDESGDGPAEPPLEHARSPRALKDRHLEAGYVLLCVAHVRRACRVRVGPDVAAELVSNPWG